MKRERKRGGRRKLLDLTVHAPQPKFDTGLKLTRAGVHPSPAGSHTVPERLCVRGIKGALFCIRAGGRAEAFRPLARRFCEIEHW